ncbi:hypothetical protein [Catellatospora sichuanensis]|uniref:hypothetical protein n=1 Tax=Catellatospora sichuanensis TaxID=1969805 RepID=UPI001181E055|nr:hypothetical protein [Catellatospora sichuanensis]
MRFLTGRALALTHTFLDDESELTPDTVTVSVMRQGATTPAFEGPASKAGSVYTVSVPALPQGVYTALWTGDGVIDATVLEVVGGYLFTIPELRKSDEDLTPDRHSTADVRRAREITEREFESITGRSFTPRTRRMPVGSSGESWIWPGLWDAYAVANVVDVAGADVTASVSVDELGGLVGFDTLPCGVYWLDVSYGFKAVPDDIHRAALLRARSHLVASRSGIPDRATSFQPSEGGTYTLSTPGVRGSQTGIPDVDKALSDYTFSLAESVSLG